MRHVRPMRPIKKDTPGAKDALKNLFILLGLKIYKNDREEKQT